MTDPHSGSQLPPCGNETIVSKMNEFPEGGNKRSVETIEEGELSYEPLDWKAEDEAAERFAAIHEKQEERWQRVGRWYEEYFALKFTEGNLPKPQDALLGSRLRIQISIPHGDWVDWRRDGKYE